MSSFTQIDEGQEGEEQGNKKLNVYATNKRLLWSLLSWFGVLVFFFDRLSPGCRSYILCFR